MESTILQCSPTSSWIISFALLIPSSSFTPSESTIRQPLRRRERKCAQVLERVIARDGVVQSAKKSVGVWDEFKTAGSSWVIVCSSGRMQEGLEVKVDGGRMVVMLRKRAWGESFE